MFDNINTKYENAKIHISFMSSFFAVIYLKREIKRGNDTAENLAYLSKAYDYLHAYKKSFITALKAVKKDSEYIYGYIMAAQALTDLNKYKKAEKYLEKASEIGNHYFADILSALCELSQENNLSAIKTIRKIEEYKYDFPEYLLWLFVIRTIPDYELRFSDFANFIKSHVKYRTFLSFEEIFLCAFVTVTYFISVITKNIHNRMLSEISLFFEMEDYETATKNAKKLLKKSKNKNYGSLCYFYLSLIEAKKENPKKSLKYINQALLYEKNSLNYFTKATIMRKLDNPTEGLNCIDKAEKLSPDEFDYDYARASIYLWDFEEPEKALKHINKSLLKTRNSLAYTLKGYIFWDTGKINEAKEHFARAFELNEADDQAAEGLARCYNKEKDRNNALIYINKAILLKKNAERLTLKGDILSSLGKKEEAEKCYKEAEQTD